MSEQMNGAQERSSVWWQDGETRHCDDHKDWSGAVLGALTKDAGSVTCGARYRFQAPSFTDWFMYRLMNSFPYPFIFSLLMVYSKAQWDLVEITFKGPVQSRPLKVLCQPVCGNWLDANAVSLNYTTVASFPYYHYCFLKTAVMLWHFGLKCERGRSWSSNLCLIPWKTASPLAVCTSLGYLLSGSRRVFVRIIRGAFDRIFGVMQALLQSTHAGKSKES